MKKIIRVDVPDNWDGEKIKIIVDNTYCEWQEIQLLTDEEIDKRSDNMGFLGSMQQKKAYRRGMKDMHDQILNLKP